MLRVPGEMDIVIGVDMDMVMELGPWSSSLFRGPGPWSMVLVAGQLVLGL